MCIRHAVLEYCRLTFELFGPADQPKAPRSPTRQPHTHRSLQGAGVVLVAGGPKPAVLTNWSGENHNLRTVVSALQRLQPAEGPGDLVAGVREAVGILCDADQPHGAILVVAVTLGHMLLLGLVLRGGLDRCSSWTRHC